MTEHISKRKRLTEASVQRMPLPAKGKQDDHYDAVMPGLILRVNYGGAKVWRALYYLKRIDENGKHLTIPTTFKLGRYPVLSLQQARQKAREFLADPDKAKSKAEAGTFKDIAENFIKRHVDASKLRSKGEIVRCLAKYVYPHWGNRSFREIKRGDVSHLLDHIEDNHGKRQADIVLSIIRRIMNWFATRDDDYVSCVVKGMKRANSNGGRARILSDDEIRALWKVCTPENRGSGGAPEHHLMGQFGAYVLTLLLTGQRRTKVATMRWDDLVDGAWHIRSDGREKDHAGVLKLPKVVIDILQGQPRINPYVFAGNPRGRRKAGPAAFNGYSEGKKQLDAKLPDMPPWVLHDLRRTARSLMSRAGVPSEHAERVLGHAIVGVEGIYNRYDFAQEKADALKRLAALVATIVNPPAGSNVVTLAGSGSRKRRNSAKLSG
jgi:integrase